MVTFVTTALLLYYLLLLHHLLLLLLLLRLLLLRRLLLLLLLLLLSNLSLKRRKHVDGDVRLRIGGPVAMDEKERESVCVRWR